MEEQGCDSFSSDRFFGGVENYPLSKPMVNVMLGPGRDKCRPSKVKGSSYTGLLVMRTHTRTSWQGSRV